MNRRLSDDILAADLEAAGLNDLAERARRSEFNDYFGDHDLPQHALMGVIRTDTRLTPTQIDTFCAAIIDGKYDASQAEADEWIKSDDGRQTFAALYRVK